MHARRGAVHHVVYSPWCVHRSLFVRALREGSLVATAVNSGVNFVCTVRRMRAGHPMCLSARRRRCAHTPGPLGASNIWRGRLARVVRRGNRDPCRCGAVVRCDTAGRVSKCKVGPMIFSVGYQPGLVYRCSMTRCVCLVRRWRDVLWWEVVARGQQTHTASEEHTHTHTYTHMNRYAKSQPQEHSQDRNVPDGPIALRTSTCRGLSARLIMSCPSRAM